LVVSKDVASAVVVEPRRVVVMMTLEFNAEVAEEQRSRRRM
jgi:hypothetical protein